MPAAYDKTPVVNENDSHFQGRMGVNSSEFGTQPFPSSQRGFAQKVENGHCSGLSLRLRAFALALRGPPAISQIAVLSAFIDRRYNAPVGYVENNLITGEAVTYRARLHWILFVKPTLIALVIIAIGGLVFYAAE